MLTLNAGIRVSLVEIMYEKRGSVTSSLRIRFFRF